MAWLKFEKKNNPVKLGFDSLTHDQRRSVLSRAPIVLTEGGNQSGKTRTACLDLVSFALNQHLWRTWSKPPSIWACTTTYEQYTAQAWNHVQSFLLYPGESIEKLPTYHIKRIQYVRGKIVKSIELNNGAEITVKSYDSGAKEFQTKTVDHISVDEECPGDIWEEINARLLATIDPRVYISATPVIGEEWLDKVRAMAEDPKTGVQHIRLNTEDNPCRNEAEIARMKERFKFQPEVLELRLKGIPFHATGLVYNDILFRPEHVIDRFPIPRDWTRYRCIDPGWKNCACLWLAVSPNEESIVAYREHFKHEQTIRQNAKEIAYFETEGEVYAKSWIDPAALGTDAESGERLIDLWHHHGVWCDVAPNNRVMVGLELVKDLLTERSGFDRPKFRVFRDLENFLRERRTYRRRDQKNGEDNNMDKIRKRDDHLMDTWRYLVAAGLYFIPARTLLPKPDPKTNAIGYAFWLKRHPKPDGPSI